MPEERPGLKSAWSECEPNFNVLWRDRKTMYNLKILCFETCIYYAFWKLCIFRKFVSYILKFITRSQRKLRVSCGRDPNVCIKDLCSSTTHQYSFLPLTDFLCGKFPQNFALQGAYLSQPQNILYFHAYPDYTLTKYTVAKQTDWFLAISTGFIFIQPTHWQKAYF